MKKLVIFILLVLVSCGPVRHLPSETVRTIRDSIYIEHVDTVHVELIKEVVMSIERDSSHLETKYAESTALIDTNGLLTHTLKNKDVKIPVQVVNKEVIVYKDSIVYKEVPIEVEKQIVKAPKSYWVFMIWTIFSIVVLVLRFKKYFTKVFVK